MKRSAGVLMHISSLPGGYSCGSFGKEAFRMIDRLEAGGFSVWQVLPFCMPDEHGSPYSSYSAFSGNPYFIDLEILCEDRLLTREEIEAEKEDSPYLVDFERLRKTRIPLLKQAGKRALQRDKIRNAVERYGVANPEVKDFSVFMAKKEANGGCAWYDFQTESYDRETAELWLWIQYEFAREWANVRAYAHGKGIRIVGDIPIYVAYDSSDVYSNLDSGIFELTKEGKLKGVAGVPPDFFSEEGQLWGNPLYNWKNLRDSGFDWWLRRLRHVFTQFDGVRIDHFRGLASYWSIPIEARSAKEGCWKKGPGKAFTRAVNRLLDELSEGVEEELKPFVIAEDLGVLTPDVNELLLYSGFPGMRVLQFAFLGDKDSPHLPHHYMPNSVAYTGTHDNNTLLGFFWELSDHERRRILSYCGYESPDWEKGYRSLLRAVWVSSSSLAVFPVQDLLGYGADTRLNTPGTSTGNWRYRATGEQLDALDLEYFAYLNDLYGRS